MCVLTLGSHQLMESSDCRFSQHTARAEALRSERDNQVVSRSEYVCVCVCVNVRVCFPFGMRVRVPLHVWLSSLIAHRARVREECA